MRGFPNVSRERASKLRATLAAIRAARLRLDVAERSLCDSTIAAEALDEGQDLVEAAKSSLDESRYLP